MSDENSVGSQGRRDGPRAVGPLRFVAEGALAAPPEVVAALAAAVEALWPRPPSAARPAEERGAPEYVWRFSGRWWSRPVPLRRDRPWVSRGREQGQLTGGE